jgi:pilus assembly protein CpaC
MVALPASAALSTEVPAATTTHIATLDEVANKEIVMFVGEIKAITAHKISRVAIGNGGLISTRFIDENQLLLIAEAVGDSSLVLWTPGGEIQNYTLRIGSKDSGFAYRAAKSVLGDINNIQIAPMGPSIAITGTVSKDQLERINQLVARYPQIVPLLKVSDVEMKKMIYMKVQILEVKKSLSEMLGVTWPGSITGPQLAFAGNLGSTNAAAASTVPGLNIPLNTGGIRTYLGISTLLQTTINLAKNNGDLTVLAEPELSARSGDTASFLAGGQIPILGAGALGTTNITYKDYGIKLNIRPTADDNGNIIASIKAELSQVDSSTAVNGTPGFLTRMSETEINVKSGQTMVISGLINRDMQNGTTSVPGLGKLPIIGRLFRSDAYSGQRTDLLIAVTPVVVDPSSTINRERIDKGVDMKERFERNLSKKDVVD